MSLTQDHHPHSRMNGKEQFALENIAREQFAAALFISTQIKNTSRQSEIPRLGRMSRLSGIIYIGHKKAFRVGRSIYTGHNQQLARSIGIVLLGYWPSAQSFLDANC